jgi:O-antigen ligase
LAVVCLAALGFRMLSVRALAAALGVAGAVVAAILLLPLLGLAEKSSVLHFVIDPSYSFSDSEHWVSVVAGFRMFREHPVFGAGLGAFIRSHLTGDGRPLIIHSTPLWLLAEMGVVGFLTFAVPCLFLLFREARGFRHADMAGRLLILSLIAFGAMSQIHELLYQRTLWLLLGAALIKLPTASRAGTTASAPAEHRVPVAQREIA